jgi:hypothetical protein
VVEAAENRKAKITMKIPNKKPVYEAAGISMEFDFFIYVSIFLTSFGHMSPAFILSRSASQFRGDTLGDRSVRRNADDLSRL